MLAAGGCFDPEPTPAGDESSSAEGGSDTEIVPPTTGVDSTTGDGETTGGETTTADGETTEGPPAECGDGVVDAGEACDAGGESARCNSDCTVAACGDGVVNTTAGETCDDAGASETCNASCTMVSCGDGFLDAGEECDAGGKATAACDADCTFPVCGDGVFNEAAEECDEGAESAACDADCTAVECGDSVVNMAAGELCDEGMQNAVCDIDCTPAECGDGYPNFLAGELCDDGGESAGCNDDCLLPACGDGNANEAAGEQCDTAGSTALCDVDCTLPMCGDALHNAAAGEQCDGPGAVLCTFGAGEGILLSEDFSDNLAGWTLDTEWGIGPAVASPSPGACANGDPGTDHTPTGDNGVAGVVIGGNASTALHDFYWLTSPVFAGYGTVELDLWRWLNSDYTRFMQNRIEVWDGAAWQIVWQSGGAPGVADAAWTNLAYDLSAYANPAMQIRIGFNVASGGAYTCSQWNVDDITITGPDCV